MRNRYFLFAAMICATSVAAGLLLNVKVLGDNDNSNAQQSTSQDQHRMEKDFFKMAASGNTLEIRAAKLAQEKATDPQVKQVAQMIQSDHEQANHLLTQITQQNHIDVSADKLNSVDTAQLDELKKKDGDEFNRAYLFTMVGDHAQDELCLAYQANRGQGGACQQYASQVLPKTQMHLHALERIARPMCGLSNEAETAGMHQEPTR